MRHQQRTRHNINMKRQINEKCMQYKRQNDSSIERISASCKTNICFSNFLSFIRFGSFFREYNTQSKQEKSMSRRVSRLHLKSSVSCSVLFRICNMLLHASIRNRSRAANSNYNTIMVDVCNICDSIIVKCRLK